MCTVTYLNLGAAKLGLTFEDTNRHIRFNDFTRHYFDPIHKYKRIWSTLDQTYTRAEGGVVFLG